jgi:very-short-patch-repair endonuclease
MGVLAPRTRRPRAAELWALAEAQHGVVSRAQLLEAGLSSDAVRHRMRNGRLHPMARGIYAVGRPELSRLGEMMVAVLALGPGAVVSHATGAELWGVRRGVGPLEISVPTASGRRRSGVAVHHRRGLTGAVTRHRGVPVTSLPLTLIDMALRWSPRQLEAAVNQADALDLLDPVAMRSALDRFAGRPGVRPLRRLLDEHTFRLTDSELERQFLRLVRRARLPLPATQRYASSWRVDFVWPVLGLVVETDSLRYHRTPSQQNRDYQRDHAHRLNGLTPLRFTHFQVSHQADYVLHVLRSEAARLSAGDPAG